jgi:MFS family permease
VGRSNNRNSDVPDSRLARPSAEGPQTTSAASSTLAPFRSRIFLAIWIASLLSNFGTLFQGVGAAWLMTSLAPSADMVALVQVATVLPIMLFSLPAGAAADVWDRRVVMLVAQGAMLVVSAALAVLAWRGLVTPWLLLVLTFLLGTGAALYGPAWQSSVREQVPRPDLPAAVALNSVSFNLARAAGPALGGVIVAWAGAQVAFGINAVSYLGLVAVLISWKRPVPEDKLPPETMLGAMLAGLRFARLSHSPQAVLVRSATLGFFAAALWALIPLVARDLLGGGAITYGRLLAACASRRLLDGSGQWRSRSSRRGRNGPYPLRSAWSFSWTRSSSPTLRRACSSQRSDPRSASQAA